MSDRYRQWDAAYVLGALTPQERRELEDHMASCAACRDAVAELAGMPAALQQLDHDRALALDAADEEATAAPTVSIGALATAARRHRRRRRGWQAAAAVGLVVAGAAAGAALVQQEPDRADVMAVTLDPVGGSGVSADLSLTPSTWGTSMAWSCQYPGPPGGGADAAGVYELVLVGPDGERSVVATWAADGDDHASGLLASWAMPLEEISRVELGVEGAGVLAAADLDA